MSKRQIESKHMSFSDISKHMTTRSKVREKSSTSASNPPNVTNIERNTSVDGYKPTMMLNPRTRTWNFKGSLIRNG